MSGMYDVALLRVFGKILRYLLLATILESSQSVSTTPSQRSGLLYVDYIGYGTLL